MTRLVAVALVLVLGWGCERGREATPRADASPSPTVIDRQTLEPLLVRGLDAAVEDRAIAEQLDVAGALASAPVSEALERSLARVVADRDVQLIADRLLTELQDSPAMRAALVEYAKANPSLDVAALQAGFVGHVEQRLTRVELAEQLELALRLELRATNLALAQALLIDAHGDATLARLLGERFAQQPYAADFADGLQIDRTELHARLTTRASEPRHAGELLLALGEHLRTPVGQRQLAALVDDERFAALLGAALSRLLLDDDIRARCKTLFALALAPAFDPAAFARELSELLDEPVVTDEAKLLLRSLTLEPWSRAHIDSLITSLAEQPGYGQALMRMLD